MYYNLISSMKKGSGFDSDALSYINAVPITNTTQKDAVNTLVLDLKSYGLWSKIKAFYPAFLTTAAENKWNLKDPRDLNAAYRLTFFGGITHSLNGMLGDGTSGYAYTNLPANTFSINNMSIGWYNMNNLANSATNRNAVGGGGGNGIQFRYFDQFNGLIQYHVGGGNAFFTNSATQKGMYVMSRQNSTQALAYKNGTLQTTATQAGLPTLNSRIFTLFAGDAGGGSDSAPTVNFYGAWQGNCIFFADGMNGTEVANMTTAINTFNTALGRGIDTDALAFITNANITDNTQQNAINTLVMDLKSANIWTKMKAIYPMVGGTAATHRFNLKSPGTSNSDFYLDFFGGWTHSSNGALPNGTTAYANTKLVVRDSIPSANFNHLSYYSRTAAGAASEYTMATYDGSRFIGMIIARNSGQQGFFSNVAGATYYGATDNSVLTGLGFAIGTQQGTNVKFYKNSSLIVSNTSLSPGLDTPITYPIFLCTYNNSGSPASAYSNKQCAFASIGDGLSDAEVLALNTVVQAFNTTLGRNV